ncbi:hypothetical protein EIP86_008331 [Pleurotus ostreatoroseus]|nr:hypothetical protein EIP86_008331 [Pleurotus ostreatoroseus]
MPPDPPPEYRSNSAPPDLTVRVAAALLLPFWEGVSHEPLNHSQSAGTPSPSPTLETPPPPPPPPPVVVACPALHTAIIPEPALCGSIAIRVLPRCGIVGRSDKVEWRLFARPPSSIAIGSRVALCDAMGGYRNLSRTVGPVVGVDRHWVTFLLSPGLSATATTQTLSIPRENSRLPLLLNFIFLLLTWILANEHPFAATPLPDLD